MKQLFKIIYSNKLFAVMMLVIQIAVIVLSVYYLSDYRVYLEWVLDLLTFALVVYELNRPDNPSFKMTWIVIVVLFPVLGALIFIYTRIDFTPSAIRDMQSKAFKDVRAEEPGCEKLLKKMRTEQPSVYGTARFLSRYGSSPVFDNSTIKYYPLGDYMLRDIIDELKTAQEFIFLEYFIINRIGRIWQEIYPILRQKAQKGVDVRIIYDGMGSLNTLPPYYEERLNHDGIKCHPFLPVQPLLSTYQNNRDHRKITVIDGRTAFTGGINLSDEYANITERYGHWKDTGIRIRGSAVAGFTSLFLQMWNGITETDSPNDCRKLMEASKPVKSEGIVMPYADTPLDKVNVGLRVYIDMINHADRHINIMTPYLTLDDEVYNALRYAVQRGVEVNIILPHIPDKAYAFWLARTYYPQLLRSGIHVFEYTPGFVHAKTFEIDSRAAVVGTINLDYRSLFLHYECAAMLFDVPEIADIYDDFKKMLFSCEEITMEKYKRFSLFERMAGQVIKLIAPLL